MEALRAMIIMNKMADILKVLVVLFMCGLIGVKSQDNMCSKTTYDRCIKNLAPLLHTAETFYIKYTIGRMGELCNEYQSTKACIQQFEQHCDTAAKNVLQSTHAYYEYICENSFSVFVKYRDCLVRPELEARAHSCNNTFFQSVIKHRNESHCGAQRIYIDCLSTEVRIICGQEAADWQLGLDIAILKPLVAPYGCSLDGDSQSYCTREDLDRCFSPLVKHPIEDGSHIVPTHTVENMIAICKSYTEVRPCIDVFIHECHPHDQRYLRSLHDSYKYICDDNLEEYIDHRDCLAEPKLHSEGRLCESSFYAGIKSGDYYHGTAQYQLARLCQHANTLVDCVENLVESFCGRDAAAWQRGLDVALYKPFLEYIECEIKTGTGKTAASTGSMSPGIISAIIIPVLLIIIVIIVVVLLICRYIKKKRKESNSHMCMNEDEMGPSPATTTPSVVFTVPSPVSVQEQGAMATLPPDLLPPEYTEKPQFGYTVTPEDQSNTRDSVLQPPDYENVDFKLGST